MTARHYNCPPDLSAAAALGAPDKSKQVVKLSLALEQEVLFILEKLRKYLVPVR